MTHTVSCPDCGSAPTNHKIAWLSVFIGSFIWPFQEKIMPKLSPQFVERASIPLTRIAQLLHLGKTTYAPDDTDNWRTRALWDEANIRGIKMEEFHLLGIGNDLFIAKWHEKKRCFDGLPRPYGEESQALSWMDDKEIMRKKFTEAGIPVAPGGVAWSREEADALFCKLEKPLIVKPKIGSRSRHTTTHISDIETFRLACKKAWQLSPWILIEEELEGPVFRGTLVSQKVVAVMRRDPACVIGDGTHTVRELAEIENKRPERQGPLFHHVPENGSDAEKDLERQGVTWDSIPKKNEIICLAMKTSRGVGGATTDVTDEVHPDNIELLEKVGHLLKDSLVGIDFIMKDISVSWKEQKHAGIIECNSMPFIDLHHYPLNGKPRNIAGIIWDLVFPDSKPQ